MNPSSFKLFKRQQRLRKVKIEKTEELKLEMFKTKSRDSLSKVIKMATLMGNDFDNFDIDDIYLEFKLQSI